MELTVKPVSPKLILGIITLFTLLCSGRSIANQGASADDLFSYTLEQLLAVEIETAGKKRQRISDVAQTAYIITAKDIARHGYTSMMEALDSLSGISLQKNWYLDRLVIRGQVFTLDKLLLLIDGQAMTMRSDNYNILNGAAPVDMSQIERLEVVLGPNSTLYGSSAFSGVINVITKTLNNQLEAAATLSSAHDRTITLNAGKQLADYHLDVHAGYTDNDGDKLNFYFPDGAPPNFTQTAVIADGFNRLSAKRLAAKVTSERLKLQARYSQSKVNWPHAIFDTDINNDGNYYLITHKSAQMGYSIPITTKLNSDSRVYYLDASGDWHGIYEGELWLPPRGEVYSGSYVGIEQKFTYFADNFSFVAGIEYTDNNDVRSVDYVDNFENSSLFSMIDYQITPEFQIELGARAERYSYRDSAELMPQVGLIYTPSAKTVSKLSYSRGFIAASTWYRQLANSINKQIAPVIFDAYEMSLHHTFDHWHAQLTGFYSVQSDNITRLFDGNTLIDLYNSNEKEYFKGGEFRADLSLSDNSSFEVNVSYVNAYVHSEVGDKTRIGGVSKLNIGANYTLEISEQQHLSVDYHYVSDVEGYPAVGDWHRIDLIWQHQALWGNQVTLKLVNALDEEVRTFNTVNAPAWVPDLGRHLQLSVTRAF